MRLSARGATNPAGLWQFIASPLLVQYPSHSRHCVAADPEVAINLADVNPATPADGGSLSGDAR